MKTPIHKDYWIRILRNGADTRKVKSQFIKELGFSCPLKAAEYLENSEQTTFIGVDFLTDEEVGSINEVNPQEAGARLADLLHQLLSWSEDKDKTGYAPERAKSAQYFLGMLEKAAKQNEDDFQIEKMAILISMGHQFVEDMREMDWLQGRALQRKTSKNKRS